MINEDKFEKIFMNDKTFLFGNESYECLNDFNLFLLCDVDNMIYTCYTDPGIIKFNIQIT